MLLAQGLSEGQLQSSELASSLTRLMARGYHSFPRGPLPRAAQDMAAGCPQGEHLRERQTDRQRGQDRNCNVSYKLISKVTYHE